MPAADRHNLPTTPPASHKHPPGKRPPSLPPTLSAVDLPMPFVPTRPNTWPGRGMGSLRGSGKRGRGGEGKWKPVGEDEHSEVVKEQQRSGINWLAIERQQVLLLQQPPAAAAAGTAALRATATAAAVQKLMLRKPSWRLALPPAIGQTRPILQSMARAPAHAGPGLPARNPNSGEPKEARRLHCCGLQGSLRPGNRPCGGRLLKPMQAGSRPVASHPAPPIRNRPDEGNSVQSTPIGRFNSGLSFHWSIDTPSRNPINCSTAA